MFYETVLPNGLTIIAELHSTMHSVAAGFFVRAGSRDESDEVAGVSHFLEHMAFKGAGDRTADDVNRLFDDIGASYNASTSEETTLYYAAVLPEYLPEAFDLLAGLMRPDVRQEDFDVEKQVILEEIGMYDDMPGFVAYEKLMGTHFAGHPLGRSILGSNESITALTPEQMKDYHASRYGAGNLLLAVAGNTTWAEILKLADRYCAAWTGEKPRRDTSEAMPVASSHFVERSDQLLQTISQAAAAPSAESDMRAAAEIVSSAIGDDSGSRLYWDLVDRGTVESAELSFNDYDGSGVWMTYLSCLPDRAASALDVIGSIYETANRDGLTDDELERAKTKICSRLVLQSERPMGRLSAIAGNWMTAGKYRTVDDELDLIQRVTPQAIRDLLDRYPIAQTTTVGVGPLAGL